MSTNHYDIIIIGTEIGGGTITQSLATTEKKILILERGGIYQKKKKIGTPVEVVEKGRYRTKEKWFNKDNKA